MTDNHHPNGTPADPEEPRKPKRRTFSLPTTRWSVRVWSPAPDGAETHYYYAKDVGDTNVGNYTSTGLALTAAKDAKNQYLCFSYDKLNRLTGKYSGNNTTCNGGQTLASYTYDAVGNRTAMTDTAGNGLTTSRTYNL